MRNRKYKDISSDFKFSIVSLTSLDLISDDLLDSIGKDLKHLSWKSIYDTRKHYGTKRKAAKLVREFINFITSHIIETGDTYHFPHRLSICIGKDRYSNRIKLHPYRMTFKVNGSDLISTRYSGHIRYVCAMNKQSNTKLNKKVEEGFQYYL